MNQYIDAALRVGIVWTASRCAILHIESALFHWEPPRPASDPAWTASLLPIDATQCLPEKSKGSSRLSETKCAANCQRRSQRPLERATKGGLMIAKPVAAALCIKLSFAAGLLPLAANGQQVKVTITEGTNIAVAL